MAYRVVTGYNTILVVHQGLPERRSSQGKTDDAFCFCPRSRALLNSRFALPPSQYEDPNSAPSLAARLGHYIVCRPSVLHPLLLPQFRLYPFLLQLFDGSDSELRGNSFIGPAVVPN